MRILPIATALALATADPSWCLVLADPENPESHVPALATKWLEELDSRAIVRIYTPLGTTASGVLLKGGTHVLTAAHVANCVRPGQVSHGLVDFPNAEGQRRHWKSVTLHPGGTTPALRQIWDAALIELDEAIPDIEVPGLLISADKLNSGQLVAFAGFGERGSGKLGAIEASGTFILGFNHLDHRLPESCCQKFRLAEGDWPLWIHDFDTNGALGSLEAHFASGDSGGAGLVLDDDGRTRLSTLTIARHRGSKDSDHRLNGSFGELGLSLDVRALLPWLKDSLALGEE